VDEALEPRKRINGDGSFWFLCLQ